MAELDNLFGSVKTEKSAKAPFDKAEWAQQKQLERERAFALIDTTAEELSTDSGKFKTFLDVQSRFDRYSLGNALLIAAQKPEATRLADSKTWSESGVYINKGETAVVILEPGEEYTKEDGTIGVSYNVKKVFDISQTNAKQPEASRTSRDERLLVKSLINNAPVPINISDKLSDGISAEYQPQNKVILVRQGLAGDDIFRALSRELALAQMDKGSFDRGECEFPAYCVSYVLCKRVGIDVSCFSFDNLPASYAKMDAKGIRAELGKVRDTAKDISANMARVLEPQKNKSEQLR